MSGVNVKIGPSTENLPNWGIDPNGKLFVDVSTLVQDANEADGVKVSKTKRYSENNVEFKKRLKYLINPNTNANISTLSEARSLFENIGVGGVSPSSNKAISQSDFNSKWSKLKSGQSLVGPDGQTYIKK